MRITKTYIPYIVNEKVYCYWEEIIQYPRIGINYKVYKIAFDDTIPDEIPELTFIEKIKLFLRIPLI